MFNHSGGGGFNTAIGFKALFANTTGQENAATGNSSLLITPSVVLMQLLVPVPLPPIPRCFHIAVGNNAISKGTTASNNTAIGTNAMNNTTTGGSNTAVGRNALNVNTTGTSNTAIGNSANVSTAALTNATAIGNGAITDLSNKIRLGNNSVTSIGGQVGFTTFGDARFKQNIKEETHGLDFIKLLKPVSYNYDINGIDNFWGLKEDEQTNAEAKKSRAAQINNRYSGFLAQDVDKAAQSINYNFSGIDKPADDSKSTWGLRYGDFVVPLVKAVQELSGENDALKTDNAGMKSEIGNLKSEMNDLKIMLQSLQQNFNNCNPCVQQSSSNQQVTRNEKPETAKLEQNIPNPFNNTTTINYTLTQKYSSAKIIVVDKSGKVLKEINISGSGKGSLKIDASTLASGAYNYSLYVDGKLIGTKQMVLAK